MIVRGQLTGCWAVLVGALAAACDPAGRTLTVRLQTGLSAEDEVGFVETRVYRGTVDCDTTDAPPVPAQGREVARADQPAMGRGELTIATFGGLASGTYTVRARLLRPPADPAAPRDGGAVLAQRCALASVTNDRVVRIAVTSDCIATSCPAPAGSPAYDQCLNGRCTDPGCDLDDPSTRELCCDRGALGAECDRPTACTRDADCVTTVSCTAAPSCIAGACVETGEDTCAAGSYCDRTEDRCLPRLSILGADAGSQDGGDEDAGPPEDARPDDDAAVLDDAASTMEICDNGRDDDGDGFLDCEQTDVCTGHPDCDFSDCTAASDMDLDPTTAGLTRFGIGPWLRADTRVFVNDAGRVCGWGLANGTTILRPPSLSRAPTVVLADPVSFVRFDPGQMLTARDAPVMGYNPTLFAVTAQLTAGDVDVFSFSNGLTPDSGIVLRHATTHELVGEGLLFAGFEPVTIGKALTMEAAGFPPMFGTMPERVWLRVDGALVATSRVGAYVLPTGIRRMSIGGLDSTASLVVGEILTYETTGAADDPYVTQAEAYLRTRYGLP